MKKNKKFNVSKKIINISKNLMLLRLKNNLVKNKLTKTPESIDKYMILKEYYLLDKLLNNADLEFKMAKFLYNKIK